MAVASWNQWSQDEKSRYKQYETEGNTAAMDYMNKYVGPNTGSNPFPGIQQQSNSIWNDPMVMQGGGGGSITGGPSYRRENLSKDQMLRRMTGQYRNSTPEVVLQQNQENSYSDRSTLDELSGLTNRQVGDQINAMAGMQKGNSGTWYGDIWEGAKNLGAQGWGDLAMRAVEAYSGFKKLGLAKDQHKLALDTFGFQKAAWNKDYEGRKLAYNTNADNVNAWKAAQGRTDFNKLMV